MREVLENFRIKKLNKILLHILESKIYKKVTKIIIQDLDEVYARLITVTTNCRVIKDPYLHKVLNFCYNYCYVQGVDSLQKISLQFTRLDWKMNQSQN